MPWNEYSISKGRSGWDWKAVQNHHRHSGWQKEGFTEKATGSYRAVTSWGDPLPRATPLYFKRDRELEEAGKKSHCQT